MVLNIDTVRICVGIDDKKDKKDHRISPVVFGRILGIICLVITAVCAFLSFAEKTFLYIGVFFGALSLLTFVLTHRQIRLQKKAKALDFCFITDVCTGKYTDMGASDITPTNYLYFAEHGKRGLETPFSSVVLHPSFEETEIGDEFYFLYIGSKVVNMFNKRYWTLDASQFEERNGHFYPVK